MLSLERHRILWMAKRFLDGEVTKMMGSGNILGGCIVMTKHFLGWGCKYFYRGEVTKHFLKSGIAKRFFG